MCHLDPVLGDDTFFLLFIRESPTSISAESLSTQVGQEELGFLSTTTAYPPAAWWVHNLLRGHPKTGSVRRLPRKYRVQVHISQNNLLLDNHTKQNTWP